MSFQRFKHLQNPVRTRTPVIPVMKEYRDIGYRDLIGILLQTKQMKGLRSLLITFSHVGACFLFLFYFFSVTHHGRNVFRKTSGQTMRRFKDSAKTFVLCLSFLGQKKKKRPSKPFSQLPRQQIY